MPFTIERKRAANQTIAGHLQLEMEGCKWTSCRFLRAKHRYHLSSYLLLSRDKYSRLYLTLVVVAVIL
jgi:hypothetical protein